MDISSHGREIPIPITSTYVVGVGAHAQSIIHHDSHPLHHHHPSNGPTPPPLPPQAPTPLSIATPFNSKKGVALVKYRECLKNHAASIGGNATDGCGEFMPSGEEGTLEALKCSACNCHRNFHRKEFEGELSSSDCFHLKEDGRKIIGQKAVLFSGSDPYGYTPGGNSLIPRSYPHQTIMPLGAIHTSESDELEGYGAMARSVIMKKRFRTRFTPEQKEKMLGFAEKVGWRLQKQEESMVQQFCQEIGVKRRILKVWMHNNKHNLAKKSCNLQLDQTCGVRAKDATKMVKASLQVCMFCHQDATHQLCCIIEQANNSRFSDN